MSKQDSDSKAPSAVGDPSPSVPGGDDAPLPAAETLEETLDLQTAEGDTVGSVVITSNPDSKTGTLKFKLTGEGMTVDLDTLRAYLKLPVLVTSTDAAGAPERSYVRVPAPPAPAEEAKDTIDFTDARGDYDELSGLNPEGWAREHDYVDFQAFTTGSKAAADSKRGKRIDAIKKQFNGLKLGKRIAEITPQFNGLKLAGQVGRTHNHHTISKTHAVSVINKLHKAGVLDEAGAVLMSAMGKKCQKAFFDSVAALVEKGELVKCALCGLQDINVASGVWELDMGYDRAHIADVLKTLQAGKCLWVVSGKRLLELAYDPTHFKPSHSKCNTGAVATRQRNYEILAGIVKRSAECVDGSPDKEKLGHVEAVLEATKVKYANSTELDQKLKGATKSLEAKCLIITEFANAVVAALEDAGLE